MKYLAKTITLSLSILLITSLSALSANHSTEQNNLLFKAIEEAITQSVVLVEIDPEVGPKKKFEREID